MRSVLRYCNVRINWQPATNTGVIDDLRSIPGLLLNKIELPTKIEWIVQADCRRHAGWHFQYSAIDIVAIDCRSATPRWLHAHNHVPLAHPRFKRYTLSWR
jgi:hypothetical protein